MFDVVFKIYGIPLEGEAFKEILHMDTYDDKSPHRIGYRKIDKWWTRRASGRRQS